MTRFLLHATLAFFISVLLLAPGLGQAVGTVKSLELLLEQHQAALDSIKLSQAAEVSKLNEKYEVALTRIKKKHQAEGDVQATLAVGHELKAYANSPVGGDVDPPGRASPALSKARKTYRESLAKIQGGIDKLIVAETEDTLAKLKSLAAKYAATDKIDDAIEADRARKELEKSQEYREVVDRLKNAPASQVPGDDRSLIAGLPRQGLVAHFPFDGNLRNSEKGELELKLSGKRSFTGGVSGRALSIENTHGVESNFVDFPLPEGGKSSFSISFCFRPDMSAHSERPLVGIGPGTRIDVFRFEFQREGGDKGFLLVQREPSDWDGQSGGAERPPKE